MEPIVRTSNAAYLQSCQFLHLPFQLKEHTTLNEKFQVHHDFVLSAGDMPAVRYVCIGNGGHRFTTGADGVAMPEPVQHKPRHAALYNHIPFVIRPLDDDLVPAVRANYRIRRIEEIDGIRYACYYMRVLDKSSTIPQLELREVDGSTITSSPYVPTITDLNPTPPPIDPGGVIVTSGNYIACTSKIPFIMDAWEINELISACEIKFGDPRYAIISEIGICSGLDKNVTGEFSGIMTGYVDAVAAQIMSFISVFYTAQFSTTGLSITFDIGNVEPLLF